MFLPLWGISLHYQNREKRLRSIGSDVLWGDGIPGVWSIHGLECGYSSGFLYFQAARYLFMLLVLYLFSGVLETWFASLFASFVGWIWPPMHFFLITWAGFLWRFADWLTWMDEFWRSLICDMAARWVLCCIIKFGQQNYLIYKNKFNWSPISIWSSV